MVQHATVARGGQGSRLDTHSFGFGSEALCLPESLVFCCVFCVL